MTIYVNERNEIKDVGATLDSTLIPIEVTDGTFDNWCIARICCYKVNVVNGFVTMLTPYVDSRLIEHINQLGTSTEDNKGNIEDNSEGIYDLAEIVSEDSLSIYDLAEIINSLDERVTALEGDITDGK